MTATAVITISLYRSLDHRFVEEADDRQRHITFRCLTECSHDRAPEWLYEATNAPERLLDDEQKFARQTFADAKLYAISIGDVVSINDTFYKCKRIGWERVSHFNDTLKH